MLTLCSIKTRELITIALHMITS